MRGLLTLLAVVTGSVSAQSVEPLQKVEAQYTEEARIAGLEGSVMVQAELTGDGSLRDLHVTRSLGLGLDDRALEAVAQWRFESGPAHLVGFPIDFTLPSKRSRWHLVGAEFKPPEGVSRPTFARADFPAGAGISVAAYDEAQLMDVIGRAASVTLGFDVDARGDPENFQVLDASADIWGPQAAMLVAGWRFTPGSRGGIAVPVPCVVKLLWGPVEFESPAIANQIALIYEPPTPPVSFPMPKTAPAKPPIPNRLMINLEPEYTDEARAASLEGTVSISVRIDENGVPVGLKLERSLGMGLDEQALEAVKQWRFRPVSMNGQLVKTEGEVQINFQLTGVHSTFGPLKK